MEHELRRLSWKGWQGTNHDGPQAANEGLDPDPQIQASFTDALAAKTIKEGVTDNGTEKMKAFGDKFNDDQIKDLVAQVRSFKPAK